MTTDGPWHRFVPPGHFYSPHPSERDIDEYARSMTKPDALPGIDLNEAGQLALLHEFAPLYPTIPFQDEATPGFRYRYVNEMYSYADAIFLHSLLRVVKPQRIIEIGSGYSSAVTLDTVEHFLHGATECSFIEPYPERLYSLLKPSDRERVTIVPTRLQEVRLDVFDRLGPGDILFIDSTHVSKVNSDVNRIFFEILPRLSPGVFIHVHDVFYPFDYPLDWLRGGRAWNEQYVLRAFLLFNSAFRIRLFGDYITYKHPDWFREHMPLCLRNTGGALWLERSA